MERLKSHRDFVAVLRHRRRVTDRDIVLHYRIRPADNGELSGMKRMGLAVSKSVGNAVTRNTVKRRFRVLAKQYADQLPDNVDIVMRAKPSAATATFASLQPQVEALFQAVRRKTEQS